MTETAAAEAALPAAPAAQTKAPKKKAAPARNKPAGPKLIKSTIVAGCPDKRGMSAIAIKKALADRGVDVVKRSAQIKLSIKRKVETGSLLQTKGVGFSGIFKAAKEKRSVKLMNKSKKPAPKKPAVKKSPSKKPASKKSPTKKSGAKKSAAKKILAKKPAAKKAAAKKPAAKKAAQKKAKSHGKVAAPKSKKSVKAKPKPKAAKPKKAAGKKK
ncbi:LOW QUALITY PROTEIN: histone H1.10-like [Pristis pectinata]|uniref:LOW QUALITY PROTEIN: histone H1.10-like n=1 Tax=Pristis pectinata TaxID=685728 RepID=UPI00223E6890|nr:LOW QUALITY PROTEIN: histone H1.10-like [Pristis pectinata]